MINQQYKFWDTINSYAVVFINFTNDWTQIMVIYQLLIRKIDFELSKIT